jgi:capsular polysaccharide transport system permease protein
MAGFQPHPPDPTPAAPDMPLALPSFAQRLLRRLNAVFMLTVLAPTVLAAVYFGGVASDVYTSESRFVVRSPQRPTQGGLGALLQGTAFSRSQDDTYSVHDFIRSRDALKELDSKLNVRESYSAPHIDALGRFPSLEWWDDSFEALHRHYLKHVSVDYDTVSSISVLRVRAYTAADAQRINAQLLEMGERLVNTMNIRSRQDLIQVAEQEVRLAEERAKVAASALSSFRVSRQVFDPDRQSAIQLQGVVKLREELMTAQAQLDQVRRVSPGNPQVPGLEARVRDLRKAIDEENARVLGRESGLSSKSAAYDRIALEKLFAERQLAGALAALDTARNEAARKQLYLERLVQPHLPDKAAEPRRLRAVLTVLAMGLMLWGITSLVIASVREHTD